MKRAELFPFAILLFGVAVCSFDPEPHPGDIDDMGVESESEAEAEAEAEGAEAESESEAESEAEGEIDADDFCGWFKQCIPEDYSACLDAFPCTTTLLAADFEEVFVTCTTKSDCDAIQQCIGTAIFERCSEEEQAFVQVCIKQNSRCNLDYEYLCVFSCVVEEEIFAKVTPCYELEDCADIESCLLTALPCTR